jgi:hypothetical protein
VVTAFGCSCKRASDLKKEKSFMNILEELHKYAGRFS